MADVKTAKRVVHVTGEDGFIVIFRPGDVIPEPLASRVTNPAAFDVEDDGEPVQAPPQSEGQGTPPAEEPEGDKPYTERSYAALQQAAKGRGLKGDGTGEVLIARLEADDREKSQS